MIAMDNNNRSTSRLVVHGHFHQPPRENPSTGVVSKDNSVSPFSNWNEKIYQSCYKSNAFSRYLSPSGRIVSISNNYKYISFNFSPTLLFWLKKNHPEFMEYLKEGDEFSKKNLGHGNAIAESLSHTILPLDNLDDAKCDIEWGMEYFHSVFGRNSEGFWLPDTAINRPLIDYLASMGIKYVILSPGQVEKIVDEDGKLVPDIRTSEVYYVEGEKERLAAFFYNDKLSEDVGYHGLLKSADALYERIAKEAESETLVQICTDGEAFGHLEPYADMALSALIRKINSSGTVSFTNYSSYLDNFKITKRAILSYKEGGKSNPYSSFHIVKKDEEKSRFPWKENYRVALNNLNKGVDEIFDDEVKRIFDSELSKGELLSLSSSLITGKMNAEEFLDHLHFLYQFPKDDDTEILRLIEAKVTMHHAFTSASFSSVVLDSLETRLSLKSATYVISSLSRYQKRDLLLPFFEDLRKAKSERTDGMQIAESEMRSLSGEVEAVIFFYFNKMFATAAEGETRYGRYVKIGEDFSKNKNSVLVLKDLLTLEVFTFRILSSSGFQIGMSLYLTEESSFSPIERHKRVTYDDVPPLILDYAAKWIDNTMNQVTYNELSSMSRSLMHYSLIVRNSHYMPMETELLENLGIAIKIVKSFLVMSRMSLKEDDEMIKIGVILDFINKNGRKSERGMIEHVLSDKTRMIAREIAQTGLDDTRAKIVLSILDLARKHGFEPETTELQDIAYHYMTGKKKGLSDKKLEEKLYAELNFEKRLGM